MKFDTAKEVWIARAIAWAIVLGISCGIIFMTTFMVGPTLFSGQNMTNRIAVALYCPGAESNSLEQGASTPTTSDSTGTYGHTVEVTCYFTDGSTKIIRNEQYALASIGGMFGIGGLIGVVISLPIFLLPFFLIRKKKQ